MASAKWELTVALGIWCRYAQPQWIVSGDRAGVNLGSVFILHGKCDNAAGDGGVGIK